VDRVWTLQWRYCQAEEAEEAQGITKRFEKGNELCYSNDILRVIAP
jgi:hypothetical protein